MPPRAPLVEIDPLDLEGKTSKERIQLALKAIFRNGLKPNGRPVLSIREAASTFKVSKTTLTARFNGRKTRIQAHKDAQKLSPGAEEVLIEWVCEMARRSLPLHASAVAAHASLIWVRKLES